ncbi:magnesium/cobalt transporter CorA [Legionella hackeliae]|uniref:Magnesium transport protein CorA n=1 Tax=Legionella hackeliae TaxID=449 RepID=A0A0A8UKY8_LEGHA|nr:magnesium/cobalt transporter CorA [Legionella hackeliae]KTD14849.1 cobalt/magnesium uptake transporter [Legionella hackeliae]CEK09525.1 Magnesium/cobalt transport protein [Legionella hackeliae]STX49432.1 metal ion transporter, MIT family [Legionella hackeliae]
MIIAYLDDQIIQAHEITKENIALVDRAIWLDLVSPTHEEEQIVEDKLGLNIPTREEMLEIELSSRLYKNKDALFMTANMIAQSESNPKHEAVSFVLTKEKLITIRYIDPLAFKLFVMQLHKLDLNRSNPALLLITLLEATVDRLADILESVGHNLEKLSKVIFHSPANPPAGEKTDYQQIIQKVGIHADLNTNTRECLLTFNRLIAFFSQSAGTQIDAEGQTRLTTLSKDINSLSDHASFISSKINFLLDATLGLINIEQNAIIKIFSVAAVIFLPPTLIASIYGMNFKWMPELDLRWGYWVILAIMLLSALLPYKFFKYKKWL